MSSSKISSSGRLLGLEVGGRSAAGVDMAVRGDRQGG
jgi:hypothetical protein